MRSQRLASYMSSGLRCAIPRTIRCDRQIARHYSAVTESGCASEIAKWYREKAVFITGATGFMGKVLVEKLLRSCPDVGPIYVLVREKAKISHQERVDQMISSCVFDKLRTSEAELRDRLVAIPGDVRSSDLGISSKDKRLLQDTVSVVFHLAATVKFNEPLPIAVAMNVEGTRAVLEMCRGMTSLCSIVHVSTAYTNCTLPVIEERVYPPPADPNVVKNCAVGLNDDLFELVTPRLVGNHPNTYTFTKALAEDLVAGYSTKLPVVIVRPSIVTASWREPIPGWIDSIFGPARVVAGAGKGLIPSVYGKGHFVADLMPVDVCVNLFIAAAWEIGIRESSKLVPNVLVYNCVSRPFKPISWAEFLQTVDRCTKKYAMSNVFGIPRIKITGSRIKHELICLLEQNLPAVLKDLHIRLSGGTPKFQNFQRKYKTASAITQFITLYQFQFPADNVKKLQRRLNPVDRVIFNFDMTKIDWEEYVTIYYLGVRKYLMNEKDETIPASTQLVARRILIKKTVQTLVSVSLAITTYFQI